MTLYIDIILRKMSTMSFLLWLMTVLLLKEIGAFMGVLFVDGKSPS